VLVSGWEIEVNIKKALPVSIVIAWVTWLTISTALSQSAPELIYQTRDHILDDAKREGNKNLTSESYARLVTFEM